MGDLLTEPLEAARPVHQRVVDLRRRIHRHPELGLELPRTQAAVLDELSDLGLEIRTGSSTSSISAELAGPEPGPTVLLRGDMDALPMPEDTGLDFASEVPGRMHACGHDAHTAMLAGAARVLADHREQLRGRVRFMFQPGEEGHHGARYMIDEGVCDGVDWAFALHITPNLPAGWLGWRSGPIMASADVFHIRVQGRGGHASMPHYTLDPVPIAAEIVSAIQAMVTRRVDAFDPAVVTVTRLAAGTTTNVIAEQAELSGTIRTFSAAQRGFVTDRLTALAQGIAAAHEAEAHVEIEPGYPVTTNHPDGAEHMRCAAEAALGAEQVVEMPSPVMGAEDFSYVLERVPGAMAFLGVCPPGHSPSDAPACHSNHMMLDEAAMSAGVAVHLALAQRLLG